MSSLSVSRQAWRTHHAGGIKTNPLISHPHQQMNRKKTDSSASEDSVSGHSDNTNKSKAIATGAAKVFNKIVLKSRPSAVKGPAEEASKRFQIVHTPDRSPVEVPRSGFPTTNEEFDAAISRMNAQEQLCGRNGSVGRKGVTASIRKGTQQSPHGLRYVDVGHAKPDLLTLKNGFQTLSMGSAMADAEDDSVIPGTVVTSPGSTTMLLGPRDNGPLDKPGKEIDILQSTPSATASGRSRPTYGRRVASDSVPPRPLSERPLIYSSLRTRPSLQTPHGSVSTPNIHSVLPVLGKNASSRKEGHMRTISGVKTSGRRPRRPPSTDSTVASSVEETDNDSKTSRHEVSAADFMQDPQQKAEDSQTRTPDASRAPNRSICYFCQEDCQPGDNLCSNCQTRFQPQEEVFDYSESEYEDDLEWDDASISSPETDPPPSTSPRSLKRRNARCSRQRENSRGWSEFSSVSQLQQLASRSSSTSPTPHVALELKVVPPQDIKIREVSSPIRANADDGRSALHHIQQAMKPRVSVSHGGQDRDAIRLGKVRSGEIQRVDIPDIIKAKPPTPKEKSFQGNSQEHQHQSGGSLGNWLKFYDQNDERSDGNSISAQSTCAELPNGSENIAVPATPGAYDRVTSIYDMYASFDDT